MEVMHKAKTRHIKSILIANRGEIVDRVLRTCIKMGIEAWVVYSEQDRHMPYLRRASQAIPLHGSSLNETYLNQELLIATAVQNGIDAIHPGYGFLSENPDFAERVLENNLIWIGPNPGVMRQMANKTHSREMAVKLGIPVIPAFHGDTEYLLKNLTDSDFPVLLKAAAGGGGRGMRIVHSLNSLKDQIDLAAAEAYLAFGSKSLFVEKYLEQAKHIEIQILGDHHGNRVHLFERECSIQRRYQKIIEESPSPSVDKGLRSQLTRSALLLAQACGYDNAGTMEFLLSPDGAYYFIETNARIQVEHPVTEMITGIDLIEQQIRIAEGQKLLLRQSEIQFTGHAIECRICAENPEMEFSPEPGLIHQYEFPEGEFIRTDHALYPMAEVGTDYDSLLAKQIVWAPNRKEALEKSKISLQNCSILGIESNLAYLIQILSSPGFQNNSFHTSFLAENHSSLLNRISMNRKNGQMDAALAAFVLLETQAGQNRSLKKTGNPWQDLGFWRQNGRTTLEIDSSIYRLEIGSAQTPFVQIHKGHDLLLAQLQELSRDQIKFTLNGQRKKVRWLQKEKELWLSIEGANLHIINHLERKAGQQEKRSSTFGSGTIQILAPLPGRLTRWLVQEGERVSAGQALGVIESMKTENQVLASSSGRIKGIEIEAGCQVKMKELLITIEPENKI